MTDLALPGTAIWPLIGTLQGISNTVIPGLLPTLFATIRPGTPIWMIVVQAFRYGALTSTQYTSMNMLVYADLPDASASNASSIASTL